jgi:hypothetical protein
MSDLITEKTRLPEDESPYASSAETYAGERNPAALDDHLAPEDSYTRDGTYWADLPNAEQRKWVNSQSNGEAMRELKVRLSLFLLCSL